MKYVGHQGYRSWGADGTKAINYFHNVAPHDGTVMITPNAGVTKIEATMGLKK